MVAGIVHNRALPQNRNMNKNQREGGSRGNVLHAIPSTVRIRAVAVEERSSNLSCTRSGTGTRRAVATSLMTPPRLETGTGTRKAAAASSVMWSDPETGAGTTEAASREETSNTGGHTTQEHSWRSDINRPRDRTESKASAGDRK